jgi:phosphoribosylformimino-5-aminoimidazole carboxamide ribotide isomerase
MLVIPAIDLRGGQVVRLRQGDPARATAFADDPAAVAARWEAEGAGLLHVVDLDGAFAGRPRNRAALRAILGAVRIPVQAGGGLRTLEAVAELLDLGVARVILGTAAVRDPGLLAGAAARHPGRICLGIDARAGRVAVEGWTEGTGVAATELARALAGPGIAAVIYTDIARDGMMAGPDAEGLRRMAAVVPDRLIASGGIAGLEDLRLVAGIAGVRGAIVGRALYEGGLSLAEAVAACGGRDGAR